MIFTDVDLRRIQVLITALKRAKYDDMHGEELLALAQVYQWVLGLQVTIQKELAERAVAPPIPPRIESVPTTLPIPPTALVPKSIELPSPIQEPEKPKRKVVYLKDRVKKTKKSLVKKTE